MVGQERRTLGVSVLVGLMWVIPHVAEACSCMMLKPPMEALAQADAVFEARSLARQGPDEPRGLEPVLYEFQVSQVWKGEVGEHVTITTASSSAACGRRFEVGETYLLYAYDADGTLSDGLCTRTRRLAEAAEDLEALGPGRPPAGADPQQGPDDAREPPRIEPTQGPPATAEPKGCRVAGDLGEAPLALALGVLVLGIARRRRRPMR